MSTIWYGMEAKRVWHGGSTVWCGGGGGGEANSMIWRVLGKVEGTRRCLVSTLEVTIKRLQ